ncbi:MAG: dynamin family protein [Peptostreptococcaceae bacterium]
MQSSNRIKVYKEIIYDLKILDKNLNTIKMQSFSKDSKANQLIHTIEKEVNLVKKSIEELKRPFLLFIIGPGKYGKSTLINALIKENLLEIKDIPNTWKLDLLISSENEKIEIIYDDNELKKFNYENGKKILKNEEKNRLDSRVFIQNELENYKKRKKRNIDELKEYKKELEKKYLYKTNICEVRYYINKKGILNDFIIVDTPGLNQSLLKNTEIRMKNYYRRADGVIWILDSQNVVSKFSNDLLINLKDEYEIDKTNNNIICVINKMDIIKNKKSDMEKVIEKVNYLYSNHFKDIILMSSKEALKGYEKKDINLEKSSNIGKLIDSINENFKKHSQEIQIKAKYKNLQIMKDNITIYINNYKRELYLDMHKFEESKKITTDEIYKIKKYLINYIDMYISIDNFRNKDINYDLKKLETIIKKELDKLYIKLENISMFNMISCINDVKVDCNIAKTKDVIDVQNLIIKSEINNNKHIFNLDVLNTKSKNKAEWDKVKNKIEKLKIKIKNDVIKYLSDIEENITDKRNKSFRTKYTDYELIRDHVLFINNINNLIEKWGD